MSLQKLAVELEETARQSAAMAAGVATALARLDAAGENAAVRREAMATIVLALQAEDRIGQRCRGLAEAARRLERAGARIGDREAARIWTGLTLEELRGPAPSGVAAHDPAGEPELF